MGDLMGDGSLFDIVLGVVIFDMLYKMLSKR